MTQKSRMLLKLTAILLGLYALYWFFNKIAEGFQSAGTILQLETSHVPTLAEVRHDRRQERRRIHRDLLDLTGSP
jgi:hypothetical protein